MKTNIQREWKLFNSFQILREKITEKKKTQEIELTPNYVEATALHNGKAISNRITLCEKNNIY